MYFLEVWYQKAIRRSRLTAWLVILLRSRITSNGYWQGLQIFESNPPGNANEPPPPQQPSNQLRTFFDSHRDGNGIYKWNHYFEIYDRHLAKFKHKNVNICEIGVYSGGSLEMWGDYFGPACRIHGVDIEPACKSYENEQVKIYIGDQADREFWKRFRVDVPTLDVIVDDGGHTAEQQIVTLEETLPHLRPGGIYICEDIHGIADGFAHYVNGLALNMNAARDFQVHEDHERAITVQASSFQAAVKSVTIYPFAVVIERRDTPVRELTSSKRGTIWQPFLDAPKKDR